MSVAVGQAVQGLDGVQHQPVRGRAVLGGGGVQATGALRRIRVSVGGRVRVRVGLGLGLGYRTCSSAPAD